MESLAAFPCSHCPSSNHRRKRNKYIFHPATANVVKALKTHRDGFCLHKRFEDKLCEEHITGETPVKCSFNTTERDQKFLSAPPSYKFRFLGNFNITFSVASISRDPETPDSYQVSPDRKTRLLVLGYKLFYTNNFI